jgi:hypothetical protein
MATKANDIIASLIINPMLQRAFNFLFTDLTTDTVLLRDKLKTFMQTVSTPVIKSGGSALSKTGAASSYGVANGVLIKIAASTDQAAYSGTVTNAKFNVFVHFVDSAGTLTSSMGTEGATLAAVVWPTIPIGKAVVSYTIINPTGTGNFVGGTTALDDGTVVPNAVYVPVSGPFDPKTSLSLTLT